jgi:hypothetical protein
MYAWKAATSVVASVLLIEAKDKEAYTALQEVETFYNRKLMIHLGSPFLLKSKALRVIAREIVLSYSNFSRKLEGKTASDRSSLVFYGELIKGTISRWMRKISF